MSQAVARGVHRFQQFGDKTIAAYSGRRFDAAHHGEFLAALGIAPQDVVRLKQVHSANIVRVGHDCKPGETCCADALVTTDKGVALSILTADCFPVFFEDEEHGVISLVHAGWRGISQGLISKAVLALKQNFTTEAARIRVGIGPGIRSCCFEVDADFDSFFGEYVSPERESKEPEEKRHIDLTEAIRKELISAGVVEERIEDCGICTACKNRLFFSYRAEKGTPERMLSVMVMRP